MMGKFLFSIFFHFGSLKNNTLILMECYDVRFILGHLDLFVDQWMTWMECIDSFSLIFDWMKFNTTFWCLCYKIILKVSSIISNDVSWRTILHQSTIRPINVKVWNLTKNFKKNSMCGFEPSLTDIFFFLANFLIQTHIG
jgi:hypothetical protein